MILWAFIGFFQLTKRRSATSSLYFDLRRFSSPSRHFELPSMNVCETFLKFRTSPREGPLQQNFKLRSMNFCYTLRKTANLQHEGPLHPHECFISRKDLYETLKDFLLANRPPSDLHVLFRAACRPSSGLHGFCRFANRSSSDLHGFFASRPSSDLHPG